MCFNIARGRGCISRNEKSAKKEYGQKYRDDIEQIKNACQSGRHSRRALVNFHGCRYVHFPGSSFIGLTSYSFGRQCFDISAPDQEVEHDRELTEEDRLQIEKRLVAVSWKEKCDHT